MKSSLRKHWPLLVASWIAVGFGAWLYGQSKPASSPTSSIERGRYLVQVSGCNDCHTPGYLVNGGNVPHEQWLIGDRLGWRGPWGTTYASNLRLYMSGMSEDGWVQVAKTLRARPPMPWFNLNAMSDADLRAIYQFVHSLGPAGEPAPGYLPPDQEPPMPYALFP